MQSSLASSSYASIRYSSPLANMTCTIQYVMPFCILPIFVEIWLTLGESSCLKASTLLRYTFSLLDRQPQRECDLFPQPAIFARAGERNQVATLTAAHSLWVRQVQMVQWQELAYGAPIVGEEEPLYGLQPLVVYALYLAELLCLLTQQ